MAELLNTIRFEVKWSDQTFQVTTTPGYYRNLMLCLKDRFAPDAFGECGGVGRCATCVVKIHNLSGNAIHPDRNEPLTLARNGYQHPLYRLSCQLLINEGIDNTTVELIEQ